MTAITINEQNIAKLEAKGFNRWQKGSFDRLYINARSYGLECEYYNSGSVRSARFAGSSISNSDARRLLATKAYINIADGKLYIQTSYRDDDEITMAIEGVIASALES